MKRWKSSQDREGVEELFIVCITISVVVSVPFSWHLMDPPPPALPPLGTLSLVASFAISSSSTIHSFNSTTTWRVVLYWISRELSISSSFHARRILRHRRLRRRMKIRVSTLLFHFLLVEAEPRPCRIADGESIRDPLGNYVRRLSGSLNNAVLLCTSVRFTIPPTPPTVSYSRLTLESAPILVLELKLKL